MKPNMNQLFNTLREYKRLKQAKAEGRLSRQDHFRLQDLEQRCEGLLKKSTKADKREAPPAPAAQAPKHDTSYQHQARKTRPPATQAPNEAMPVVVGELLEEQKEETMPVLVGTLLEAQHPWEGFDTPHGDTHDRLPQLPQPRGTLVNNGQIPAFLDAFKKEAENANKRSLRDSYDCLAQNQELFPPEPLKISK